MWCWLASFFISSMTSYHRVSFPSTFIIDLPLSYNAWLNITSKPSQSTFHNHQAHHFHSQQFSELCTPLPFLSVNPDLTNFSYSICWLHKTGSTSMWYNDIWTWNNSLAASTWWFALRYNSTALNVLFFSSRVSAYFTSRGSVSRTLWLRARSMAVFHWFRCTQVSIACCTFPHCISTHTLLTHSYLPRALSLLPSMGG